MVFPVPPPMARATSPSLAVVVERQQSSAVLGLLTFFLVLASLLVLAWLTFPYWRHWANL